MSRLNSSIAGSWYPADAAELREKLDRYRAEIEPEERREEASPDILILPHAGYIYSARTAMYGISQLRRNAFRRVVILAPSHRSAFADRLIAPEVTALGNGCMPGLPGGREKWEPGIQVTSFRGSRVGG